MASPKADTVAEGCMSLAHTLALRANKSVLTEADAPSMKSLLVDIVSGVLGKEDASLGSGQLLISSLMSCIEAFDLCSHVKSPASVMALSGPVARHLRKNLGKATTALDLVDVPCDTLRDLQLPFLTHRSQQAKALQQRLLENIVAGGTHMHSRAAACVRQALQDCGVAADVLQDAKARSRLADELTHVSNKAAQLLTPEESAFIAEVATALKYVSTTPTHIATRSRSGTAAAAGSPSGSGADRGAATPVGSDVQSFPVAPAPRLPQALQCPMTLQLMRDPVMIASGHTYERAAIEGWLRKGDTDPQTGEKLAHKQLTINWAIKRAIEEWLSLAGMTYEQYTQMADDDSETAAGVHVTGAGARAPQLGPSNRHEGSIGPVPDTDAACTTPSPVAYGVSAPATPLDDVRGNGSASKQHQGGVGTCPAVNRMLAEQLGRATSEDLQPVLDNERGLQSCGLKPSAKKRPQETPQSAKRRRIAQSLMGFVGAFAGAAARIGRSPQPASAEKAPAIVQAQTPVRSPLPVYFVLAPNAPRLLGYATVAAGYEFHQDAAEGPLKVGKYGIIIADDRSDRTRPDEKPLRVLSLQEPFETWWYPRDALVSVPESSVPEALRPASPKAEAGQSGAPVTNHTSQRGMIVQRGFDWLDDSDTNGRDGEAGMLVESEEGGCVWRVYWANGGEGTYATGRGGKFELQHLKVHALSGAPVAAASDFIAGSAVVRGLPWAYGDQDGGAGMIGSVQPYEREGSVAARWPNKCLARYNASMAGGFDLNHVARPGELVTVYNAQAGLRVTRGRDWRWDAQDGGSRAGSGGSGNGSIMGTLVRPIGAEEDCVLWTVAWADGSSGTYRAGIPTSECCDLQVATFGPATSADRLEPGTPVTLAPAPAGGRQPRSGPLKPGEVGIVFSDANSGARVQVYYPPNATKWWADRAVLQPLPGVAAARMSSRLRLNRDGRAAFLGSGNAISSGGDTGLPPKQVFYCGAVMGQCRCGKCDGRCGPDNGCPCHACAELLGKRLKLGGGGLEDAVEAEAADAAAELDQLPIASEEDVVKVIKYNQWVHGQLLASF